MMQLHASQFLIARVSFVVVISVSLIFGSATKAFAARHTCNSVDVAAFANRIHVRCDIAASGGIVFFAVATANSAHAARILSVLMMAHLTTRKIIIEYNPNDTTGTSFGCLANDCRRLLSVAVL
jgi:hypothetical protein